MSRKKKELPIIENVTIEAIAAEGKSLVRWNDMVVFVPWCVPGDVVDLQVKKKKHSYCEAEVIRFHKYSDVRVEPMCKHFGVCGGCKWQQLPYEEQLKAKENQVMQQLRRIGHIELPDPSTGSGLDSAQGCFPILGSVKTKEYRNKLDFGCSNKNWLNNEEMKAGVPFRPGIGFHITGAFDKVLPIEKCWLMDDLNNNIRNFIYGLSLTLPHREGTSMFYDLRTQHGLLRDLVIRNSLSGEWMLIVQFGPTAPVENNKEAVAEEVASESKFDRETAMALLEAVHVEFPEITSLLWVYNPKCNDTFGDLDTHIYYGEDFIYELMEDLRFKVGPKSFYQTNTEQAYHLYSVARNFSLTPALSQGEGGKITDSKDQILYDLYTGTGTIANFVARKFKKVVGIEYVPEAIEDAKVNSQINGIKNTEFFAGDMKDILTADFIAEHGQPDTIITDPPRAGMHEDVINVILGAAPKRIVYVSCNPATQARDLQLLDGAYKVAAVQPVDMFPHTPHVENVVLLLRRE